MAMGTVVLCVLAVFLMTSYSLPLWESITILQKFQFPWRILSVVVFLTSLMLGILVSSTKSRQVIVASLIIAVLIVSTHSFWKAKAYSQKNEGFFTSIYRGTTDTGESAPIWSVRFMERPPKSTTEVIEGEGEIITKNRGVTKRMYEVNAKEKVRILENTLYFPGWNVFVDGKSSAVEFQDPRYRGLMTYFVPEGTHLVTIFFSETKLRTAANSISLVSFVFLLIYALYSIVVKLWKPSR